LHSEDFHNFYSSQNVVRVIKSRRPGCGGACLAHRRDEKFVQVFGWKP